MTLPYQPSKGRADEAAWSDLLDRLAFKYGPDKGADRYAAQRLGREPDVVRWRELGGRQR